MRIFCITSPHILLSSQLAHLPGAKRITFQLAAGRINIIDGLEMSTHHSGNDYLIFGMTEEEALSKNMFELSMEELKKHINSLGRIRTFHRQHNQHF